jgi:hypothetical protein
MDKAVEVAKEASPASAPAGQPGPVQQRHRRLLRRADPAAAACVLPDARGAHHHHHALRQERDARHREGDPVTPTSASNPSNDGNVIRMRHAGADRGAAQVSTSSWRTPRARRRRSRSATSAAAPRRPWRSSSRTARSARTTGRAPRRSSTRDQVATRRHGRRPCSSTRKPSSRGLTDLTFGPHGQDRPGRVARRRGRLRTSAGEPSCRRPAKAVGRRPGVTFKAASRGRGDCSASSSSVGLFVDARRSSSASS